MSVPQCLASEPLKKERHIWKLLSTPINKKAGTVLGSETHLRVLCSQQDLSTSLAT